MRVRWQQWFVVTGWLMETATHITCTPLAELTEKKELLK